MFSPKITLTLILAFTISLCSVAQNNVTNQLNEAKKHHKEFQYSKALKAYKSVLNVEYGNVKALDGVINIYLFDYEIYDSAGVYLERRLEHIQTDTNYIVYLNYANCLRMQERHEEAIEYYNFFKKYGLKKKKRNEIFIKDIDQNIEWCQHALNNDEIIYEPYIVENMGFFINSVDAEYTPIFIEEDSLLLYNARYQDYDQEQRSEDNQYFENIYYFDLVESVASSYNPGINQEHHQAVVSKGHNSDSILVFYQNRVWVSSIGEDRLNNLTPLPEILNGHYFQPHGFFSADNGTFIFSAASMEGNLDLFVSYYQEGNWTQPKSISPRINTGMDEDAPFLTDDGQTLYFSSKGHNSCGGYDFFKSELVDGAWSRPENLGYPMNSAGDDIYISFNNNGKSGFFSSNRNGGFGGMDIYSFGLDKKTVRGAAKDGKGNLLAGVEVSITDLETGQVEIVITDENGDYSFLVEPDRKFILNGKKEDYFDDSNNANTATEDDVIIANLSLEKDPGLSLYILITDKEGGTPLDSVKVILTDNMTGTSEEYLTPVSGDKIKPLEDKKLSDRGSYNLTLERDGYLSKTVTYNMSFDREGTFNVHEELDLSMDKIDLGQDLSDIIDLKPIYFDVSRYNIRPDAALELDKIVQVMNDNPNMKIELGSHTDSRGSAKSNQALSEKRAKASADYIASRITNPERITYKGYGEAQPVNHCIDGVKCSQEEHQENRRTEFIILEM